MDVHFGLPLIMLVMLHPAPREPEPDDRGQGFFGVRMVDNGGGVNVTFVEPGTPAHKAGIRADDCIEKIDSTPVPTVDDARELIGRLRPGAIVGVAIRRGETTVSIKVRVGVRPEIVP
jgi:S1-C subfamily serine protease